MDGYMAGVIEARMGFDAGMSEGATGMRGSSDTPGW
jgi:hypothetical protein